jgi:ABC-type glycerol-3-phosphate transport system permease component
MSAVVPTSSAADPAATAPRPAGPARRTGPGATRRPGRFSPWVDIPLLLMVLAFVAPIAWMVVLAVQPDRNIVSPAWDFGVTWQNVTALLGEGQPFTAQLVNSLLIVAGTIVLCVLIGAAAGYAFSQVPIPQWLTLPMLAISALLPLIPPMTLVPGLYVTLNGLGLLGTVLGLVLVNTVFNLPFAVLLMKVYFDAVPGSLREAALVDGASELRVLLRVMLPLVRPGVASVAVFTGIMAWNEFLMGLVMTSGGTTSPLPVGIASLVQPYEVAWGQMAAAGSLAAVPIIVLAIVANRHIVTGMTGGAVKG